LSRTLVDSSTGSLINLGGAAVVTQIAAAHDLKFRGARVKKNADQTAANYTVAAAITWDAEVFDTDGFHDTGSNTERLTIPANLGINYVRITAGIEVSLDTADTYKLLTIRINDTSTVARTSTEIGTGTAVGMMVDSGPVAVVAGDYFDIRFFTESDTSITVLSVSSFMALEVLG
jgi:hypothetical protein